MDVNLQNVYTEVLLDNFVSVIKQNIMFQAQLEVLTKNASDVEKLKSEIYELKRANNDLQQKVNGLSGSQIDVSSLNTLKQEKDRLQSAVNDYMRQIKKLNENLIKAKSESSDALVKNATQVEELNKYIQKLEMVVPASKLKKVKTGDISDFVKIEEPIVDDETVKNGGTF
jgi:predicted RNase H-like nuclease (RuvC/YqgF family)